MIRVFIGYDHVEAKAFHVLCHSIHRRATVPVQITPLMNSQLKHIYTRERDPKQSNDFSFTRFLVPWLCNYEGFAIFMDCDMLFRSNISELWQLKDEEKAVQVVKHQHVPKETKKYLGNDQHVYDRKNWSSVMLFNNSRCKNLTLDYVHKASGLDLHQFRWLSDNEIGELPKEWNHLVGYDKYSEDAKNVHFTTGGPYFHEYIDCDYSNEWFKEYDDHNNCDQVVIPAFKVKQ